MRLVVAVVILLFAALLQTQIGHSLPPFGGRPDFALLVVLAWAMLSQPGEAAAVGFIGGLLLDSVSYTPFGLHGALLGLVGYLTGLGETSLYRGNLPLFIGSTVVATFGYHTGTYVVLQVLGQSLPSLASVYFVAVPSAILNALFIGPTFLLCRRALRFLAGWRQFSV